MSFMFCAWSSKTAFILSLGNWVLIYLIEVWENGAVQIISDETGLRGYRFLLCLAQSLVMGVKMAKIAVVACDFSL